MDDYAEKIRAFIEQTPVAMPRRNLKSQPPAMPVQFDPATIVQRVCAEHDVSAEDILTSLISGLVQFHWEGRWKFAHTSRPVHGNTIHDEIRGICVWNYLRSPREFSQQPPRSLLEFLAEYMNYEADTNFEQLVDDSMFFESQEEADEYDTDPDSPAGMWRKQQAAEAVFIECMNAIDQLRDIVK